jgi:hypothetical protein
MTSRLRSEIHARQGNAIMRPTRTPCLAPGSAELAAPTHFLLGIGNACSTGTHPFSPTAHSQHIIQIRQPHHTTQL